MSNEPYQSIYESTVTNDKIDIRKDPVFTVKKIGSDIPQQFILQLEGQSIDHSVVNALRRTVLMYIPVYAFHRSNTHIDNKRSKHIYNNHMIYNLIETLPIYDIPNYYDLENPELYLSNDVLKAMFSKYIQQQYTTTESENSSDSDIYDIDEKKKNLFDIELIISVKNTKNEQRFITTHDAILKVNGKEVDSYKKRRPIAILSLNPGEEIHLTSTANLCISLINGCYEATTIAVHIQDPDVPNRYTLKYKSLEQLDKSVIFTKACVILTKKLENIGNFIEQNFTERSVDENIEVELFGEEHTLGNLLATCLQKCEYTSAAGYAIRHPFSNNIVIAYKLKKDSKKKPKEVLLMCIKYLINLFVMISDKTASSKK